MNKREYNKFEMRKLRKKWRREELLKRGQCPVCGMKLDDEFKKYHNGCPYLKEITTQILRLDIK